jgi:hypothetical protein
VTTEPGSGTPMPNLPESVPVESDTAGGESTSDLLQTMLSRAVEAQLADQSELTSAVGDMRAQLMRLSQELAEMRVRPPSDDSDAQINNVTVEMREAVRFLSERLDGVTRMVAQRGEELADIRTALTAIDAHVRSQAETIGVLSAGLQALPSYGERVSVLQDNLQVLHRQLVGIEGTLAKAEGDAVGERLTAIVAAVSAPKDDSGITERLTAIEAAIEAAAASAGDADVADRLSAIESSVSPLVGRLNEVSDTGTAQSALLSQLQSSASQLQLAVIGLQSQIEPIAEDVTAIGGEVTGLVEGSADGAALDSRVSESVSQAVRDTEQRLIAHIDDAVLALAQTLLKRRVSSPPTPSADRPLAEQVATVEPDVSEPDVAGFDLAGLDEAEESEPSTAAPSADAAWWERDLSPVDSPAAPESADDEPAQDSEPDEEVAETEPERVSTAALDRDEDVESDEAQPTDGATEAVSEATGEDDEPTRLPEQADDALETEQGPATEEMLTEPAAAKSAALTEAWSPQTPPARDPSDPTVTLDDGRKRRRWRRK